jgi:hypothetical protein
VRTGAPLVDAPVCGWIMILEGAAKRPPLLCVVAAPCLRPPVLAPALHPWARLLRIYSRTDVQECGRLGLPGLAHLGKWILVLALERIMVWIGCASWRGHHSRHMPSLRLLRRPDPRVLGLPRRASGAPRNVELGRTGRHSSRIPAPLFVAQRTPRWLFARGVGGRNVSWGF